MDREPWPSIYEPDLDAHRNPLPRPRDPIDPYRRLVANPLLAMAMVVLAIVMLRASLHRGNLAGFLLSLAMLAASLGFVQFHCLDCGKTDWLLNASRHSCPRAVARWREGRLDRWRLPTLKTQLVLWLYLLVSATALILILFVLSR